MATATVPLTPKQAELVLQGLVLALADPTKTSRPLSLTQTIKDDPESSVRIAWQPMGQPSWNNTDDIVVLRFTDEDDPYNRVRDIEYFEGNRTVTYQRTWRCHFVIYGPNSYDNARLLHSALMTDQTTHDTLTAANLYFVPDPVAPQRVPEIFQSLWYERVDFDVLFNEGVTESDTYQSVLSTHIFIETNTGIVDDPVVNAPEGVGFGEGPFGDGPFDVVA